MIDSYDNRYAIISALLSHCDRKLVKFDEDAPQKVQEYLELISQAQSQRISVTTCTLAVSSSIVLGMAGIRNGLLKN